MDTIISKTSRCLDTKLERLTELLSQGDFQSTSFVKDTLQYLVDRVKVIEGKSDSFDLELGKLGREVLTVMGNVQNSLRSIQKQKCLEQDDECSPYVQRIHKLEHS